MLTRTESGARINPDHLILKIKRDGFPSGQDHKPLCDTLRTKEAPPIAAPILVFYFGECEFGRLDFWEYLFQLLEENIYPSLEILKVFLEREIGFEKMFQKILVDEALASKIK